jgi:taurine dioxygenase
MVAFTKGIWGSVIQLPEYLTFNNQDQSYTQVARVGNVKLDGTLKDSQREANYWHQDGDFWGEGNNFIFNCLHTRE